jgi:hypothetical protein
VELAQRAMAPAPDLVPLVEIGFAVVERRPLGGPA